MEVDHAWDHEDPLDHGEEDQTQDLAREVQSYEDLGDPVQEIDGEVHGVPDLGDHRVVDHSDHRGHLVLDQMEMGDQMNLVFLEEIDHDND